MMFLLPMFSETPCFGYIRASSIMLGVITALAIEKLEYTSISSFSTSSRRRLFSRASSRKRFISSSRLSFISL